MRDNLNKVEEREVKLEDLDKRGAELLKNVSMLLFVYTDVRSDHNSTAIV